jgi:hypothetical protein
MNSISENKIRYIVRQELKSYLIQEGVLDDIKSNFNKVFNKEIAGKAFDKIKTDLLGPEKPSAEFARLKPVLDTLKIPTGSIQKTYDVLYKKDDAGKPLISGTEVQNAINDIEEVEKAIEPVLKLVTTPEASIPSPMQEAKAGVKQTKPIPQKTIKNIFELLTADSSRTWFKEYQKAYKTINPGANIPTDIMNIFVKLINDKDYSAVQGKAGGSFLAEVSKSLKSGNTQQDDKINDAVARLKQLFQKEEKIIAQKKEKEDATAAKKQEKEKQQAIENDPKNINQKAKTTLIEKYTELQKRYEGSKSDNSVAGMLTTAVAMFTVQVANLVLQTPNLQNQQVRLVEQFFDIIKQQLRELTTQTEST